MAELYYGHRGHSWFKIRAGDPAPGPVRQPPNTRVSHVRGGTSLGMGIPDGWARAIARLIRKRSAGCHFIDDEQFGGVVADRGGSHLHFRNGAPPTRFDGMWRTVKAAEAEGKERDDSSQFDSSD